MAGGGELAVTAALGRISAGGGDCDWPRGACGRICGPTEASLITALPNLVAAALLRLCATTGPCLGVEPRGAEVGDCTSLGQALS